MAMSNDEKARVYDSLIAEHDKKAREVSLLNSKFDLTKEDTDKIKKIKREMDDIQRKAVNLSNL